MPYTQQTWQAGRDGGTPLSVARMTHIENGLGAAAAQADTAINTVATAIAGVNSLATRVTNAETTVAGAATTSYVDTKVASLASQSYVDNQLATKASTGYVDTKVAGLAPITYVDSQVATKASTTYVDNAISGLVTTSGTIPGLVQLDSFSGTNDDDKLTNALSYVAAQTQKPAIMFPARFVSLTQSRTMFSGMKLIGPPVSGFQNPEQGGGGLNPTRVRLNCGTGSSSWLIGTSGDIFDVAIRDLSFESTNANTQFIHYTTAQGTLYCCNFHNLGFLAFRNVLGNESAALAMTLCSATGDWNMNAARGTQVYLQGSDNVNLWTGGSLNVGPAGNGTNLGGGAYLVKIQTQKSNIGNVYITADDNWRALQLSGSTTNQQGTRLTGWVIEGRNTADPSVGALVKVSGGNWSMRGVCLNYAMSSPSTYTDATDRGYVHMTSGALFLDDISVDRATGVADTVPVAFISGGELAVSRFSRGTRGGSWTGRPVIQQTTSGLVAASDYSVTVTTAP
jgi:hypothetical protein